MQYIVILCLSISFTLTTLTALNPIPDIVKNMFSSWLIIREGSTLSTENFWIVIYKLGAIIAYISSKSGMWCGNLLCGIPGVLLSQKLPIGSFF